MANKYNELQHKMANDMIRSFQRFKSLPPNASRGIRECKADIELILSYLDTKVIQNNKLTDVHAYVQCLKQFKK